MIDLEAIAERRDRAERDEYPEKVYGSAVYYIVTQDVPALLALVKQQAAELSSVTAERDAAKEDMEALMWHSGDGCTICAHAIKDTRVDYSKYDCDLGSTIKCNPKWRGTGKERSELKRDE